MVIRLSSAGDVAMTVPVLHSLLKAYPALNLTILTKEHYADLFYGLNAQIVIARTRNEHKGLTGIWRLYKSLRKGRSIDAVADLHDVIRSRMLGLLFRLSGIKVVRIDKERNEKKELTRKKDKNLRPLKSNFSRYSEVFNKLGFHFDLDFQTLFGDGPLPMQVTEITGVKHGKWIGVAPFAAYKWKEYPLDKLRSVLLALSASSDNHFIFFGGGNRDNEVVNKLIAEFPGSVNLVNRISLADEIKTMKHLDVMLAMDSANMHFASLVNIPVVSIWGATHPFLGFAPWDQPETNQVQLPLFCRPCSVYGNVPCYRGDHACMESLPPELVINRLNEVLFVSPQT